MLWVYRLKDFIENYSRKKSINLLEEPTLKSKKAIQTPKINSID